MNLQDHIEYIRNRCLDAIANGDKMDVADWRTGEGIYMTFNEAIEIVNEIDRLKAGNAELLEALKKCSEQLEYIFKRPNCPVGTAPAIVRARKAIENAEKK